jgi:hypothetical protein
MENAKQNKSGAGLSDLQYNLVTILKHKAEAVRAYETYRADAQQAESPGCAELIERIHQDDLRHIEELKQHVMTVLQGATMSSQQESAGSGDESVRRR